MTEEQYDQLKLLLRTDGWRNVMKPLIAQRQQVVRSLSFKMPSERPKPYSDLDDQSCTTLLKGENKALEWVLNIFEQTVAVIDAERRKSEEQSQNGSTAVGANPAQPA